MNNKSLFVSIILSLALMFGFFFHKQEIRQFKQKINAITNNYNAEINATNRNTKTDNYTDNTNALMLENLNNQLITVNSALKKAQQKSSLQSSKSSVLTNEISQIKDTRNKVKSLKTSLKKSTQKLRVFDEKLKISDKKLDYLQRVFESQNKKIADHNLQRITQLQDYAAGIGISGLLMPLVGVAMLTSYTIKEIDNYCANIKNIINLEEQVFKKVVSLDAKMQQDYRQKCTP